MKNKNRIISWIGMIALFAVSTLLVQFNASYFQASIVPTKNADPYDGLTLPITTVPNWVMLSGDEWDSSFNKLPASKKISIPEYNANDLKKSSESLVWGKPTHDMIRNAKITYSVVYMGGYTLDGQENTGSHLAVDIKTAKGTPVYAIGNGVVTKTSNQSSGFGKHIVIEHKNFPSFNNPNVKATYYSSYSHLDSVKVNEGDVVKKGDLIGTVGDSGTATTDHLHFQIDNDKAPWHPYWPFTSSEASNAGMSFFEAVNEGLNQDDAIAKTIHPMMYVQKYSNGSVSTSVASDTSSSNNDSVDNSSSNNNTSSSTDNNTSSNSNSTTLNDTNDTNDSDNSESDSDKDNDNDENTVTVALPDANTIDIPPVTDTVTSSSFEIEQPLSYIYGVDDQLDITVTAIDPSTREIDTSYQPDERIRIELITGSADISPRYFDDGDFNNGIAKILIKPKQQIPLQFRLKLEDKMIDSKMIYPGIFADLSKTHPNYKAINFLKEEGVIQGYPDGTFKPSNSVSRVEALKFILEGLELKTAKAENLAFKDTKLSDWYADYVATAYDLEIVKGYPDGNFKPGNTVNQVEFLKMLVATLGDDFDIDDYELKKSYRFVDQNAWYAPYLAYAIDKNLIEVDTDTFKPFDGMKRESVAEAIYRMKVLRLTKADKYSENLDNQIK